MCNVYLMTEKARWLLCGQSPQQGRTTMTKPTISAVDKARILTHEGHNADHTVKGLKVRELRELLAERDVLASIVKDLAGSEVLRPQPPQSLLASFCDVCGNAVALDGDHGEADWCAWWRACVWLDQQGEKK